MLKFRWENIWTYVSGEDADIRYLQSLLAFPNKRTGVTQYMYDDRRNRLLSGLVDRVSPKLKAAGIEIEVVGRPERVDITSVDVNPNLLEGATLREFQVQSLRKAIWAQRGILKLPTGCLAGDSIIGVNRGGKGYSTTMARGFVSQSHSLTDQTITTMVRSFLGDRVGLHATRGIVYSGQRETYELLLGNGKTIRATADHEILTEDGYVPLADLTTSHKVICEAPDREKSDKKAKKPSYRQVQGLVFHRYANGVVSTRWKSTRKPEGPLKRVPYHRLVVEAALNNLDIDDFVQICRTDKDRAAVLFFLDPKEFAVHHKDENHRNNSIDNLQVLTHEEHQRVHGDFGHFGYGLIESSNVKSVKLHGIEDTYDIVCEEPYRNFVANGIVVHNSGKTIVSAAIAKYLDDHVGLSSLMIVPGVNSLNQSWARWRAYGLKDVGRLGDGHQDLGARHLIAVVNSAYSLFNDENPEALEWSQGLGCVMWMEAHHAQAMMWAEIGKMADVPYRFGLTATPFMNGGDAETFEDYTILGISGEIVANVPDSLLMNLGIMAVPRIHFMKVGSKARFTDTNWHTVKRAGIVNNDPRNAAIVSMASRLAMSGRKVVVLINEIEHCKVIARGVSKEIGSALVFHGGSKLLRFARGIERKSDKTEIHKLNEHLDELDSYVLIGSPAIDEDADFPSADTLIVGAGGRSPRRVVQRAGRVLRPKQGENTVDIIDFEDYSNVVLRSHSKKRNTTYLERYSGAKGFKISRHDSSDSVVGEVLGIGGGEGSDGVEEVSVRR